MKYRESRKKRRVVPTLLVACAAFTVVGLLILSLRSVDPPPAIDFPTNSVDSDSASASNTTDPSIGNGSEKNKSGEESKKSCASVEEMGKPFRRGAWKESLRVRRIIQHHFDINGASRVRNLPAEQFCGRGFVLGKASEAGFGNEMYKLLNAAALSIMLNRSLIIGQTRGKYPFGDHISYSGHSFTMRELKHLWRQNNCVNKSGRHLVIRVDEFERPKETDVLCSNWKKWKQPIIWFQNTTDAVASQFFLKNVHPEMRNAAFDLFGKPDSLHTRPNVFGELMKVLISPSKDVEEAVNWVLSGGRDPDISLHMRMLMNRSVRALQAALSCVRKAMKTLPNGSKPRVVLVSDTPTLVNTLAQNISEFAEVLRFDYKHYRGDIAQNNKLRSLDFRVKDWGPAPRWVAFVDFFLASRAKHAVVSGAHKRVGTTYAQLIAALAAANHLGEDSARSSFSFLSSFQSNLLTDGLRLQVGWGHVWNRFAGPLSCHNQPNQCAFTPLLPPAWWDDLWQSPIPRDLRRLATYGIFLSDFGTIDEVELQSFCSSKKKKVKTVLII
ncbi:uncharacterized protein LOC119996028 isoform X2 [Tripterygium wilfordii]|uniref:uncharacterized protein LOC119996028 isoform X2 n=1 Tax=Tripterygium wilfordii TaxID=458696 RepID=UPI0018F848D7|nr:uncharacterized protein LOC119996028 isoform X2 [Tripterygium wilfordii]